jgi:putative RNA 2'-phosphotransferase
MTQSLVSISKFLSLVLRHRPETIGLVLDTEGWADVDALLRRANAAGVALDREVLRRVVAGSDKQRFALSADGRRIRANYGHSIPVELGLEPAVPPDVLFHGTASRFLDGIGRQGLVSRGRNYVHLSPDEATAQSVGRRHGRPVVLRVQAGRMQEQGFAFYRATDGTWLTERVPARHLSFPEH